MTFQIREVALIGRNQILYKTALKLREQGYKIHSIITGKAAPEYSRTEEDFRKLATDLNARFLLTNTLNRPEVTELCQGLDLGLSINWISVVQEHHINLFRLGILNSHLGDLPKYRGNACANWAILKNEETIINTIHFMEGGKLDCGKVVDQLQYSLNEDTSITDVYNWAEEVTPDAFVRAISNLENNPDFMLKYANPDDADSFRCYPRLEVDSYIDWTLPAKQIHNLIRAVCYPFSGAYTYYLYKGEVRKLVILKSRIIQQETRDIATPGHVLGHNKETGESYIQCGQGVIALLRCRHEGDADEFSPAHIWKSIRMRLGIRAEDWLWHISRSTKNT